MHAEVPAQLREWISLAAFGGNADGIDHCFARQWLSEQRDNAKVECTTDVLVVGKAGHQDDLGRQRIAKGGADGKAVGRRHDQIEQNNIGIVDGSGVQGLTTRRGSYNRVPLLFQPEREELSQFV